MHACRSTLEDPTAPALFRSSLRLLGGPFHPIAIAFALCLGGSLVTRLVLMAHAVPDLSAVDAGVALASGLGFDVVVATYFSLPLALWLAIVPKRIAASRAHRAAMVVALGAFAYLMLLIGVMEWIFWDEFGARFNFIAVDYLVYTREVLGNIMESYPVGRILLVLLAATIAVTTAFARPVWRRTAQTAPFGQRFALAAALAFAAAGCTALVSSDSGPHRDKDTANELGRNGVYQLFAAFRGSSLDFNRFYALIGQEEAEKLVRAKFRIGGDLLPARPYSGFERLVLDDEPEKPLNVVLVSIESLGADYVGAWGDPRGLTPNLDRLAAESLVFGDVYATGNRTVRGLEALSLAIPPTPGEAIVKRPGSSALFSLGGVFEDRGYETLFIYGGYGYFDNMNAFFTANDYKVVDRRAIPSDRIHHETIWGVADEDLFDLSLAELDRTHAAGKRFFAHVMTTSNHRPYTYPAGRIDIPSGTGREGAVKYTDYALGRFIESAKQHAWFKDTLFVITADHGANARGTFDIPVDQYRIPLLFYSPAHMAPGRVDRLMSQIDIGPTILGRLHMSYRTKFFGRDIFRTPEGEERAFVGNYQALGYLRDGRLVTLVPQRGVRIRKLGAGAGAVPESQLRAEAIAWYQMASYALRTGQYGDDEANYEPAVASLVEFDPRPERVRRR